MFISLATGFERCYPHIYTFAIKIIHSSLTNLPHPNKGEKIEIIIKYNQYIKKTQQYSQRTTKRKAKNTD